MWWEESKTQPASFNSSPVSQRYKIGSELN